MAKARAAMTEKRQKYHRKIERPLRWVYREGDPSVVNSLMGTCGLEPVVARIVAGRASDGDTKAIEQFLSPRLVDLHDPFLLADMEPAVTRTRMALRRRERIAIYGDYDCDGMTATALLVRTFRFLGTDVETYIPHRLEEGYGLNRAALEHLAAMRIGLIITVDNGITAVDESRRAQELGLELIITDHHRPAAELPQATAVIDPNRADCPYPNKYLTGVGVAFKFAHALLKSERVPAERAKEFLRSLLELVAIGTIADAAPLVGENRAMVRYGLESMTRQPSVGVRAMRQMWELPPGPLTSQIVMFRMAPRLNAAGRTADPSVCVDLLTTDSENRALEIAFQLEHYNAQRKRIERQLFDECQRFVDKYVDLEDEPVLVIDGKEWHIGVIGIVASRLVELYRRPTIVISTSGELGHGSGRSLESFNLHRALVATSDYLAEFGGHTQAAGLRIPVRNIRGFRRAINAYAHQCLDPQHLVPTLTIDTTLAAREFDRSLLSALGKLEPFGEGNPTPVFSMSDLTLAAPPRVVATNHLKLIFKTAERTVEAIGFNFGEMARLVNDHYHRSFEAAFHLSCNQYHGDERLEMLLKDLRWK